MWQLAQSFLKIGFIFSYFIGYSQGWILTRIGMLQLQSMKKNAEEKDSFPS